jgi:hypothetical protein
MADSGTSVIFLDSLPADVPGFYRFEQRRAELKKMLRGRKSMVAAMKNLRRRLSDSGVAREPMVDSGLDYVRRTHDSGHHYFVANMGDRPVDGWIALAVPFKSAAIMDPRSGGTGVASMNDGGEVYIQLLPGETRIIRTFADREIDGLRWPVLQRSGEKPVTVAGEWRVAFIDGGPEKPAPFKTRELLSWTRLGDSEAKRFAGTAVYRIEFVLPGSGADDWVIDLGDVRESARVSINGRDAATLWSVPFRVPVGEYLRPGRNVLEVEVTNLSANRVRDMDKRGVEWKIFHDVNFVDHNYKPFDASKWDITESGLLGPVRLVPMRKLDP